MEGGSERKKGKGESLKSCWLLVAGSEEQRASNDERETINSLKNLLELNFSQWFIDGSRAKENAFVKNNFIYRN